MPVVVAVSSPRHRFSKQPVDVVTLVPDLLGLPTGARLRLGADAVVEVTGLRNPCVQLDRFRGGLMAAMPATGPDGAVELPAGPPVPLRPV